MNIPKDQPNALGIGMADRFLMTRRSGQQNYYFDTLTGEEDLQKSHLVGVLMFEHKNLSHQESLRIVDNQYFKPLLLHIKSKPKSIQYKDNTKLMDEIANNKNIMNTIKKDIELKGTLKDLDQLDYLKGNEYKNMYNKVISVGEYTNV